MHFFRGNQKFPALKLTPILPWERSNFDIMKAKWKFWPTFNILTISVQFWDNFQRTVLVSDVVVSTFTLFFMFFHCLLILGDIFGHFLYISSPKPLFDKIVSYFSHLKVALKKSDKSRNFTRPQNFLAVLFWVFLMSSFVKLNRLSTRKLCNGQFNQEAWLRKLFYVALNHLVMQKEIP